MLGVGCCAISRYITPSRNHVDQQNQNQKRNHTCVLVPCRLPQHRLREPSERIDQRKLKFCNSSMADKAGAFECRILAKTINQIVQFHILGVVSTSYTHHIHIIRARRTMRSTMTPRPRRKTTRRRKETAEFVPSSTFDTFIFRVRAPTR